jgi:hypothetical protein
MTFAASATENLVQFADIIPAVERFVYSIIAIGKLPDPLSSYTDPFIAEIFNEISNEIFTVVFVTYINPLK